MPRSTHGRKRRLCPAFTHLEGRALLASVASLGQDGVDLLGPDASQGPDGIQDLHLRLTGLSGTVGQIAIRAPGGFEWATAPNPTGSALAEYFPSSTSGTGDLYLSPRIKSALPPVGGTLPLGGSTGSLISLANGTALAVAITYQNQAGAVPVNATVSGLASPTLSMPAIAVPDNVISAFQVVDLGQDGSGQPFQQGFVHLVATSTNGLTFNSATFNQVLWALSDQAGLAWDSSAATLGHNHVYASLRPGTNNVVDLYFPPACDESPASGTTAPTMTLRAAIPGSSSVYAARFAGGAWSPSARANPLNNQMPPGSPPSTEAQLRALLASTNPEYDTIVLPANATIVLTQPLEITHSVALIGNNSTLLFRQGAAAPWPAAASGAIYVNAPAYTNIRLELSGFTLRFDMSAPIRWSNPPGAGPALFDPENNPAGIAHAVIDTRDSNSNLNLTVLKLTNMQIFGPPAFDGAAFNSIAAKLRQSGDTAHEYVGELAIELIRTNDQDTGSIASSSFQGGAIDLHGGPWNVTGNTITGSMPWTYSPAAFALHSPHDVVIEGNHVTQADPNGRGFRLVSMAVSGHNNLVQGNTFGGGGGQLGNEVTFSATNAQFWGINDPEIILAESTFGVLFEGRPGAVSGDGRLLVLPAVRAWAAAGSTGPGLVVSILSGVGQGGTSDPSHAGKWFRVAQQVTLAANNSIELLMEDPLPAMPAGGYYVVEVTGGFANNTFNKNQINLSGRSSIGLVLNGADFGSRITNNQFIGGLSGSPVYSQIAISLTSVIDSAASGTGKFPLPQGWTALPNLGTVVQGNTIRNFLGGMIVGVQHWVDYWQAKVLSSSETGRVLVSAYVSDNVFQYDAAFLSAWAAGYQAFGNNVAQEATPPPLSIGSGWSPQAPGPYGNPRFPWTIGAAITVNGANSPIFVDPAENVVTVQANSVEVIGAGGAVTTVSGATSQVYAGTVNGTVTAPAVAPQSYRNQPYYPFNLKNLDIGGASTTPPPPPPPPAAPTPSPPQLTVPTGLYAGLTGANQVTISWNAVSGADHYIVERSTGGTSWSVIAPFVNTTSYVDANLVYLTTYSYCVVAVSTSGATVLSSVVSARTGTQADALSAAVLQLRLTRGALFTGPVANFSDANKTAAATQFVASINWGDGRVTVATVSGAGGTFTVSGRHKYARNGRYTVRVAIALRGPAPITANASSVVVVSNPARQLQRARKIRRLTRKTALRAR